MLDRKNYEQQWYAGLARITSLSLSFEHSKVLNKSLQAYVCLALVLFEDHKEGLRRIVFLEEDSRRYKAFGQNHLPATRRVLAGTIKYHQRDHPFSNAWKRMATINTSSDHVVLDPFLVSRKRVNKLSTLPRAITRP